MQKKRLVRYLNSVGKECFSTYFHLFNDNVISNYEIAKIIHKEKGYTEKACNSRTGHARMIIREGGAKDALRIIIESSRLEISTIKKAEQHLKKLA